LPSWKGNAVLDFLMLALLAVAFAGAVGYVHSCVSLTEPGKEATDRAP
jgi:nitrate reductase NapE component